MHQKNYDFIHKKSGEYYKVVEIPYEQQQIYMRRKTELEQMSISLHNLLILNNLNYHSKDER